MVLTNGPYFGFMPSDVRSWMDKHCSDADLAELLAEVGKKTGVLGHELDEFDDPWLLYAFEEWWDLEKEIYV